MYHFTCDTRSTYPATTNSQIVCDSTANRRIHYSIRMLMLLAILTTSFLKSHAAPETFPTGAYIVNLGVVPQTIGNGLKPYGLLYEMLRTYKVPVRWVITPGKAKDGIDFTHNGVTYRGSAFIIPAAFRTSAVNSRITYWQGQGVIGATTTSPLTVDVHTTFTAAPRWTMDKTNGSIATKFFINAGIPATAHGGSSSSSWLLPSQLTCCDDIFVMPHADPVWSTHQNLLNWNLTCKGSIWLGCHSGSALEDMFNPSSPSQQTNFLAQKTGNATGGGPYSQNALILWGNHSNGTLPYSYDYHDDPVMQFMGTIDIATQNGSEQVFIPLAPGWRPSTKVGVYDPDHPQRSLPYTDPKHRAGILVFGHGFGDLARGQVMMNASHDIAKATGPANIAAQRAFFNFSFLGANGKAVVPTISAIPDTISSGVPIPLSWTIPPPANPANYTTVWTSTCGGTFSPSATAASVTYTPPAFAGATPCNIAVEITDNCGRKTFANVNTDGPNPPGNVVIICDLGLTRTVTNPTCSGNLGSIAMSFSNGTAPYSWTWTRTSPAGGPTNGTGTSITGLSAGLYQVVVTSATGCSQTFTQQITQPAALAATTTPTNILCFGQNNGSINLNVTGGTAPITYNWGGGITTEDRSNLIAGTYSVIATDAAGCTVTTSVSITQPSAALNVSGNVTQITCSGGGSGAIDLTVTGGTGPYTYNWGGGITTQNRTGLAAGTYNVIVTDANGCTVAQSYTVNQPGALSLSVAITHPSCVLSPPAPDGAIALTVSGGSSPYVYDWSDLTTPPAEPEDRSNLAPGTYTVIVTDSQGCTATISATLNGLATTPNPPATINH
jgi:hypothetical protein